LQKVSDEPLEDCPACSAAALRRLISAPVFQLKGSGWYETDFKSDKERKRNLADAAGSKQGKESKSEDGGKEAKKTGDAGSKPESSSDSGAKKESGATTE